MATYTQQQIENVWFALNLNRLKPNNDANSGAGLHNPNGSINMYKWLQDALMLIGGTGSGMNDNIYNADGTLTGNRTLTLDSKSLTFQGTADPAHSNTLSLSENYFGQTVGRQTLSANNEHNAGFTSASVGVISFSEMQATLKQTSDYIRSFVRTTATGSGFERTETSVIAENVVDNTKVGMELVAQEGAYPTMSLQIATNYEYGLDNNVLDYMVPSVISTSDKIVRYTYPLDRHHMAFGNSGEGVAEASLATGAYFSGAEGFARTLVHVSLSCRTAVIEPGTFTVDIIEASSGLAVYSKTIDTDLLVDTYGVLSEEALTQPLNISEYYYGYISAASGGAGSVKGLVVTMSII